MLEALSGDAQTAEVGTDVPQPMIVRLTDLAGAPLRGVAVQLTGDVTSAEHSTDAAGIATFRWRLLGEAREQRVTARARLRSSPAVEFRANAVPGPTTRLTLVRPLETVVGFVGSEIDTIVVTTHDRFGNPRPEVPVTWSITRGGGSVRPLTLIPSLSHRAIWTLGPAAGENTVVASVGDVRLTFSGTAITDGFAARQISTGGEFTCALSLTRVAYCWGHNEWGQLGAVTGTHVAKHAVKVQSDEPFVSLVSGTFHTCGLTDAGAAICWGANWAGQLGFMGEPSLPRRVTGVPTLSRLAAGAYHTCGLTSAGVVYCWGDNAFGQIGSGGVRSGPALPSTYAYPDPVEIAGGRRYVDVAAGVFSSCAITTIGDAYCWGNNSQRELGRDVAEVCRIAGNYDDPTDYDAPCSTVPVRVNVPTQVKFRTLVSGGWEWCAISTTDQLWCWAAELPAPQVASPRAVRAAWIVEHAVCAEEIDGSLSCWNGWTRPGTPRVAPFGTNVALGDLSSVGSHSCGISRDAQRNAYCWGVNSRAQLGDGTVAYRLVPTRVLPPK